MMLYSGMAISSSYRSSYCCISRNKSILVPALINFQSRLHLGPVAASSAELEKVGLVDAHEISSEAANGNMLTTTNDRGLNDIATLKKNQQKPVVKELGAFQQLPMVACASELLGSAKRKARNVGPTKGIANIAKRERNKGAKQLDALTKELALPLRTYIEKFPRKRQLHAYEYSLIDLTFGTGKYEESTSKATAEESVKEGFSKLEEHFERNGGVVDELLRVAKTLRAMPVLDIATPTLCLVGAPNVGKSSLVRVLSTGKPEICNYPFTTRGISMGHIFLHAGVVYQVTDTPGLLRRLDDERNNMEKLTLAALSYLPTAVLYVHDLTGECGVRVSDQFKLYQEIKERFMGRPWLDVVSKADLLPEISREDFELSSDTEEYYELFGPEGAMHVSVQTGMGIQELKQKVNLLLSEHFFEQGTASSDNQKLDSEI